MALVCAASSGSNRGSLPPALVLVLLIAISAAAQERRIPRQTNPTAGAIQGLVHDPGGRGLPGATVILSDLTNHRQVQAVTNADGVFRFLDLRPASYEIQVSSNDWEPYLSIEFPVAAGEVKM